MKKSLKIAFVVSEFPNLSETFILNQITGLTDLGHDITIFSRFPSIDTILHPDIEKYDLIARTRYFPIEDNWLKRASKASSLAAEYLFDHPQPVLNSLNFFRYKREAASLRLIHWLAPFLGENPDIIFCHFGNNALFAAHLKELGLKGKLVTMFHGYDIRLGIEKGAKIYRNVFQTGDLFFSISEYNSKHLLAFGADPSRIIKHPVGIDVSKFSSLSPPEPFPPNEIRIITVARLVKEKNLATGIEAISLLNTRKPGLDIKWRIIGDGPERSVLESMIEEHNLNGIIELCGSMNNDDVAIALNKSHIFLLTSESEALPVVLMEAHAAGLPCVCTNVGSTREIVLDDESGYVVPPDDPPSTASALEKLVLEPEKRKIMGMIGRKHIENNYDVNILNRKLSDIFVKLSENQLTGR